MGLGGEGGEYGEVDAIKTQKDYHTTFAKQGYEGDWEGEREKPRKEIKYLGVKLCAARRYSIT